jgi:hypothetical protein
MKSQGKGEPDPIDLIRRFNKEHIGYLLIGSMALSMHDAPFGSADWDFWVSSEDRVEVYDIIERFGLQGKHKKTENRPLDTFTDGEFFKVDVFFVKAFSNKKKGITIDFSGAYVRAVIKKDPVGDFFVRVPILEDLVTMLKIVETPRSQHLKHIEYLEALLHKKKKNKL